MLTKVLVLALVLPAVLAQSGSGSGGVCNPAVPPTVPNGVVSDCTDDGCTVTCDPGFVGGGVDGVGCDDDDEFFIAFPCSVDVTDPTITCPADQTDEVKGNAALAALVTVTDDSGSATVRCAGVRRFKSGAKLIKCRATDAAGNQATCNFSVNVGAVATTGAPNAPPTITCPADQDDDVRGNKDLSALVTVTGNHPEVLCRGIKRFPSGAKLIKCRATDSNGQASCTFTVNTAAQATTAKKTTKRAKKVSKATKKAKKAKKVKKAKQAPPTTTTTTKKARKAKKARKSSNKSQKSKKSYRG